MVTAAIVAAANTGAAARAPGLALRDGNNDSASMDGDIHGWLCLYCIVCCVGLRLSGV